MPTVHDFLAQKGIDRLDRELLLAHILKKDRSFVLAHPERKLTAQEEKRYRALAARRERHEPLAYILGAKEFFGRNFLVSPSTLIPRPETELLVEEAIKTLEKILHTKKKQNIAVIDVGTGSGAIIMSIAKAFEKDPRERLHFFATDISQRALTIAKKNSTRAQLKNIIFTQGDLLTPVEKKLNAFDLIILLANLPYLSEKLYRKTPPEVHDFEPKKALLSGTDGLSHYRRLFSQIRSLGQAKKIVFFLEISPEQAKLPLAFLSPTLTLLPDLAGKPRLAKGTISLK